MALESLKLVFQDQHALRELSLVFLILLGHPPGSTGAHQRYNRTTDDQSNETQPEKYDGFHRYVSAGIAAYPSTETES
jgi:hypothetical protein